MISVLGMSHRLKLFPDQATVSAAIAKTKVQGVQQLQLGDLGFYLKRPFRPNVEPRFLCADGRWRKYDDILDLPHSAASEAAGA